MGELGQAVRNTKCDDILKKVAHPNMPTPEAVNHMVYCAGGSSKYHTHHHIVDAYPHDAQENTALVEEEVFYFQSIERHLCWGQCELFPRIMVPRA